MNDLQVAKLVLVSVSAVDGGCVPCVQSCIDEAIYLASELPWDEAALSIPDTERRSNLREAIASSRLWLAAGNPPRTDDNQEDLVEIVI